MKKLELCKDCDAFCDCESHCDDALHYKKLEGSRKAHSPEHLEERLIDRTVEFADNSNSDPSMISISQVNKFNRSKLKKRKLK